MFILLGLGLNRILDLGIFLGADSFRSPLLTRTNPSYLTRIQLYLHAVLVLYKHDAPVYKKVSYLKKRSLLVLHIFVLPDLLTRVLTQLGNSLLDFLPKRLPGFLTQVTTRNLTRAIPGAFPKSYPYTYQIGLTQPYPSAYPTE
jgi:hypothetical protein